MSWDGRRLTDEEAASRPYKNIKAAASTSFSEAEVLALDTMISTLRRGGDARVIVRSAEIANVSRKLATMKASIGRQHDRRAIKASREASAEGVDSEDEIDASSRGVGPGNG